MSKIDLKKWEKTCQELVGDQISTETTSLERRITYIRERELLAFFSELREARGALQKISEKRGMLKFGGNEIADEALASLDEKFDWGDEIVKGIEEIEKECRPLIESEEWLITQLKESLEREASLKDTLNKLTNSRGSDEWTAIRTPDLDKLRADLETAVEALEKIRSFADPEHYIAPQAVWADQALSKLRGEAG